MNALAKTAPSPQPLNPDDLRDFEGEVRISDARLAELLGYDRPRKIRDIIRRHLDELQVHGISPQVGAKIDGRGRPEKSFMLNEAQAILVTMFSRTQRAAEARRQIVQVFIAWRHGHLVPAQPEIELPAPQPIEDRYPGTRASRFLEELCRVYAFDDPAKLTKAFSIPKQALVWMQSMGSGEEKYLKRLAPIIAIAGCDMRYIEYGTRTYTREERALIAELRQLPDSQRALAFYRLGQSMEQLRIAEEREDT